MSKVCGSQGGLSTILVDPNPATFSATSKRYDFVVEDLGLIETQPGGKGITGRLDPNVEHVRDGPGYVAGRIMMNISPKELDWWLPYIMRGAGNKSGDIHKPGDDTDKILDIMVKRDDATYVYEKMQVNNCMIRSSTDMGGDEPQLVDMMLSFVGVDETSGTYPATPPDVPNTDVLYWLAADSILTLGGVEYPYQAFNLLYSNHLVPLLRSGLTGEDALRPQCIRSTQRSVRFQPRLPLSSETATAFSFAKFDGTGALTFDSTPNLGNGDSSTIFTFDRLRGPRRSPKTRGRVETFHDLDLIAWAGVDDVANPVLAVTNTFPP